MSRVEQSAGPSEGLIVDLIRESAKPALLHVRSIAATYRMAARPPPSKASHYVGSLLRSIEVGCCAVVTNNCHQLQYQYHIINPV